LDTRDDESELDEQGCEKRRFLLAEQNKNFFKKETILHQKAHQKLMKQGNLNTRFFQSVIKWRRDRNVLNGVFDNGQWCEDKEVVKDKIRDFFKARFDKYEGILVRLDNVSFNSISDEDNNMLVGVFF